MRSQNRFQPVALLVDAQGEMIVECGDGIASNFRAFDLLTKKESEAAPEHSMFYLTLTALSKKHDKVIVLSSKYYSEYYQSTLDRLAKEEPEKYKIFKVTKPISQSENLGDEYIPQQRCMDMLKNDLMSLKGSCCIVVDGLESFENMKYAEELQKNIQKFYPNKNISIVNAHSSIMGLSENKFMFVHFDPEQDAGKQCINVTERDPKKMQEWVNLDRPVVIKPTNNHGGYGVIVCNPQQLNDQLLVLEKLLKEINKNNPYKENFRLPMQEVIDFGINAFQHYEKNYSREMTEKLDEIESFAESRQIPFKNLRDDRRYEGWKYVDPEQGFAIIQPCYESHIKDNHNATLRMLFLIHEDKSIELVGSFWKLATDPVGEALTTANVVSSSGEEGVSNYRLLTQEEQHFYFEKLKPKVLTLVENACQQTLEEHVYELRGHPDPDIKTFTQQVLIPQFKHSLPHISLETETISISKEEETDEKNDLAHFLEMYGHQQVELMSESRSLFSPTPIKMSLYEYISEIKNTNYMKYTQILKAINNNDLCQFEKALGIATQNQSQDVVNQIYHQLPKFK